MVVADYKTDDVEGDDALAARAAAYAPQGAAYVRAVAEALGLPETPRFELWFLAAGRVVTAGPPPPFPQD
jgi:ATP-dependent exoDNAse (exonuclease V) beta subunit